MNSKKLKNLSYIVPVIILIIILSLYSLLSFYIGKQNFFAFSYIYPHINRLIYWSIFWIMTFSYIIGFLFKKLCKDKLSKLFVNIGFFWFGLFYYFLLVFSLINISRLIIINFHLLSKTSIFYKILVDYNSFSILIIVAIINIYGTYVGRHRIVTKYNITIDKKCTNLAKLNIVFISDVHLGTGFGKKSLEKMVLNINNLKPDIIFICGDLIDENTPENLKDIIAPVLKNLSSLYGTYAVLGNHEYGAGNLEGTINIFKKANVTLLRDSFAKIANSFYVVGRDDLSVKRKSKGRDNITEILNGADKNMPIIVLDHQPVRLDPLEKEQIDLQLSGHTHHGQFFPNNLITKTIYDNSYGYLKDKNYQLLVSSGYGTWGPLIRLGTKSEIVEVQVDFFSS
ncbi:metallophosphoesterase [Clostridium akagii]|uniref:metallophosphoesterase n=1 Tax=Clostridium akagii TaxID=91623 RepID=UPI0006905707|nr:metallophosphoesterase [Clostridium akagii]